MSGGSPLGPPLVVRWWCISSGLFSAVIPATDLSKRNFNILLLTTILIWTMIVLFKLDEPFRNYRFQDNQRGDALCRQQTGFVKKTWRGCVDWTFMDVCKNELCAVIKISSQLTMDGISTGMILVFLRTSFLFNFCKYLWYCCIFRDDGGKQMHVFANDITHTQRGTSGLCAVIHKCYR